MENDPFGVVVRAELRSEIALADVDVVTEPEGGDGRNLVTAVGNLLSLHDASDPDPVEEFHPDALLPEREVEFDRQTFTPAEGAIQEDQMGAARPSLRIDTRAAAAAVKLNDQRQPFRAAGGEFSPADPNRSRLARRGDRDRRRERKQLFRCAMHPLFPADGVIEGARLFRSVNVQTRTGIQWRAVFLDDESGDVFPACAGIGNISGEDLLRLFIVFLADVERVDILPPVARAARIEQIGDGFRRCELLPRDRLSAAPDGQSSLLRQVALLPLQKNLIVTVLRAQVGKFLGRQHRGNRTGGEQGQKLSGHDRLSP